MKRFGQLMIGVMLATVGTPRLAHAQASPGSWAVQFDTAATLGHSSSSSFGGEVDHRLNKTWGLAFEAGHMNNITSSAVQDRADVIANQIGATANPVQSATYYDLGLRVRLMPEGKWNPYVTAGFGAAHVTTSTTFAVNGTDLTDAELAAKLVALGADLDGSVTKPLMLLGFGVDLPIKERYFIGGSFRYGLIFPRSSEIDGDKSVNTLRLQLGIGIRF
jgi:opacity protein-like surface antigen